MVQIIEFRRNKSGGLASKLGLDSKAVSVRMLNAVSGTMSKGYELVSKAKELRACLDRVELMVDAAEWGPAQEAFREDVRLLRAKLSLALGELHRELQKLPELHSRLEAQLDRLPLEGRRGNDRCPDARSAQRVVDWAVIGRAVRWSSWRRLMTEARS